MDSKHIEKLLEKYWNCDTSLEEEKELREFFRGPVPENMNDVAAMFRYFDSQQKQQLTSPDFDATLKKKIKQHRPEGKVVKLVYFYSRIAAGLLVCGRLSKPRETSGGWIDYSHEHTQRGSFAAAIGAQHTKYLSTLNFQIELVNGTKLSKILGQLMNG